MYIPDDWNAFNATPFRMIHFSPSWRWAKHCKTFEPSCDEYGHYRYCWDFSHFAEILQETQPAIVISHWHGESAANRYTPLDFFSKMKKQRGSAITPVLIGTFRIFNFQLIEKTGYLVPSFETHSPYNVMDAFDILLPDLLLYSESKKACWNYFQLGKEEPDIIPMKENNLFIDGDKLCSVKQRQVVAIWSPPPPKSLLKKLRFRLPF